MLFNYTHFFILCTYVTIHYIKPLLITSCSGKVIKYHAPKSINYIDIDRTPNFIIHDLPAWVNNYSRVVSEEKYKALIKSHLIDYHTSDRCLYIWDSTAHLSFDYFVFFCSFFFSGALLYVIYFFFLISLNIIFLWFIFFTIYQKDISLFVKVLSRQSLFYFICTWLFMQYLAFKFNLITLYPEEWSFALVFILIIFFFDLFWGACLLDFKIVTQEQDAYFFFYGLHFEFITFIFSFLTFVTLGLDFFGSIEFLGQNEHWTKWD